ncbi:molybdopterin molybdotransferase MoeA [bacterium]|nr:molybdopterin molybdotransferase MoeA [bacterium]
MISVSEALDKILGSATTLEKTVVPIEDALSYTLINDIKADRPIPPFNRVAMDGFAINSSDFKNKTAVDLQIAGRIQTGVKSGLIIYPGQAAQIMTGAPCPEGADAVIKIEDATINGDMVHLVAKKAKPGLNIAPMGEDAEEGKVLIEAGSPLTTAGIAICASVGIHEVPVYRKPKIKIISTGTEIIPPSETPLPHQIRDCNSFTLRVMSQLQNIEATFLGIGEDDLSLLGSMIHDGLDADILILSGGVSMGEFDHVPKLLESNGVKNIFHRIKVKPGKPVWFGKTETTYVFGLPGNPVSVQTCFRIFVEPLIKKLSGSKSPRHKFLKLPLAEDSISKANREHYMPGKLVIKDGWSAIEPVLIRGSGDYSNFEKSHGLFIFPAEIDLMNRGEMVDFLPWREIW